MTDEERALYDAVMAACSSGRALGSGEADDEDLAKLAGGRARKFVQQRRRDMKEQS